MRGTERSRQVSPDRRYLSCGQSLTPRHGTARTYARRLGHERAADLLQQTPDEEGSTDQRLTRFAQEMISPDAHR